MGLVISAGKCFDILISLKSAVIDSDSALSLGSVWQTVQGCVCFMSDRACARKAYATACDPGNSSQQRHWRGEAGLATLTDPHPTEPCRTWAPVLGLTRGASGSQWSCHQCLMFTHAQVLWRPKPPIRGTVFEARMKRTLSSVFLSLALKL